MKEYTTVEAGEALGITDQSVRNHIKAGRLQAEQRGLMRVYYIPESELRRFAERFNYRLNLPAGNQ